MQSIEIIKALSVIQWLFGVITVLLAFIGLVGGYLLKKLHNTIISDHEMISKDHEVLIEIKPMVYDHEKKLTKLIVEHDMRHQGQT